MGIMCDDVSIEEILQGISLVSKDRIVIPASIATNMINELSLPEEKICSLLSPREQEVLNLVAKGAYNKEIANLLFITENTVKVHMRTIMEKLHVHNRQQAVSVANKKGIVISIEATEANKTKDDGFCLYN